MQKIKLIPLKMNHYKKKIIILSVIVAFLLITSFQVIPSIFSIGETYAQLNLANDEDISYKNLAYEIMKCENISDREKKRFLKNHKEMSFNNLYVLYLKSKCQF